MSSLLWIVGIASVLLAAALYLKEFIGKRSAPSDSRDAEPLPKAPHAPVVDRHVEPDDLTRIKGIGPVLEQKLKQLGIVSLQQIADLTPADIQRINQQLAFPGRIERDQWVEQAKDLVGTERPKGQSN